MNISLNNINYTRSLIEIMLRSVIHAQKTCPVLFHITIKNYWITTENIKPCSCRNKDACPLKEQCLAQDIVCKCIASISINLDKTYLGTAEGDFKKRYNNHTKSFRQKRYRKETTLFKYIWEIQKEYNKMPTLKWSIVKSVPSHSNQIHKKNAYYAFTKNLKLLTLKTKVTC